MEKPEADQPRIDLLLAAVDRVSGGNRTAFGKKLGYKDGAFVRQMLAGTRPVTEKTIRQIEELPNMAGWFTGRLTLPASGTPAAAPVSMAAARGRPSLLIALEVLGEHLEAADEEARADATAMLMLYARNPGKNRGQAPLIVERLLGGLPDEQSQDNPHGKAA